MITPFIAFLVTLLGIVGFSESAYSQMNTNRPGSDYRSFVLSENNPGHCLAACASDPKCRSWTYVKPVKAPESPARQVPYPKLYATKATCWLKEQFVNPVNDTCCVSGFDAKKTKPKANVDYPGNDYRSLKVENFRACESICKAELKCRAWTFVYYKSGNPDSMTCYLKSFMSLPVPNNCCISGAGLVK